MSFLENLTPDQRSMLVTLPYRVGLYVSQSDVAGGEEADERELLTLSNILGAYAGEVFVSETVQHIIRVTLEQKDDWPHWRAEIGNVEGDCRRAVDVLSGFVDEKEVSAFKQYLMEVAEAVALAFREVQDLSFFARLRLKGLYYRNKWQAKRFSMSYKSFDEFLNISADERKALEGLAQALDINYTV